jgi:hypothetical protein
LSGATPLVGLCRQIIHGIAAVKHCPRCQTDKPTTEYSKHKSYKDGLKPWCKRCFADYEQLRRVQDGEHIRLQDRRRRAADPDRRKQVERRASAKRCAGNRDLIRAKKKAWEARNRDKTAAWNAAKRARRRQAMPNWLTAEQHRQIAAFYVEARTISRLTGVPHHVDHIEPLAGVDVCGLHVPWNLKVLPAQINLAKGNRRPAASGPTEGRDA